ncbi:MAG TPA: alpha/beta fold hydrolase [Chloroflexia bacterium]|nr:alpha/beta fold hydrolase [Chloroflexia bacterium]
MTMMSNVKIESLLSARSFLSPQLVDNKLYFISNMSGHYSLYRMNYGGSVPEPLLPSNLALFNPKLGNGSPFYVFPKLGKILVLVDHEGDEAFQPTLIPLEGGFPEPLFPETFAGHQSNVQFCSAEDNVAFISVASNTESMFRSYQLNLDKGEILPWGESPYGNLVACATSDNRQVIKVDFYSGGDEVMYLQRTGSEERELLFGKPMEAREPGEKVELNSINDPYFTSDDKGVLLTTSLFDDAYGLGYLSLDKPGHISPVAVTGTKHTGMGEMVHLNPLHDNRYTVEYNIDGCSWLYEGTFDRDALTMTLDKVVCGQGKLADGVLQANYYDEKSDRYALSFCTASSPTQLYTVEDSQRDKVVQHTSEHVLGVPEAWLSPGEDASYTTFDGLRVSARLYLPSPELGYEGRRPVVFYVHGGPQGQERPDFGWFSMPIIQFLTLNGFAVFVPNVRGSTGYGFKYTKLVEHDWGGDDVLDHMHALDLLAKDPRLDVNRAGVMGRSYGGYMSLMLPSRYPDRWAAAVDMFGPYDLISNMKSMPITWRPFFALLVGDPETESDFLMERSPVTYLDDLKAPLLVLQGGHDSRVARTDSDVLVERLRSLGKDVDYTVFEDEGHDFTRYENRVAAYNAITDFFKKHLGDGESRRS